MTSPPQTVSRRWTLLAAIILVATAPIFGGCQFAPEAVRWPKRFLVGDERPRLPDRMMVIWSDTVLHQPQQPGVRGFGGRVYFYIGKETEPIEVDGGLAVYVFDAAQGADLTAKPERKFVFTADQFNDHMSHTDMGPSYSVWLPWDEVGGTSRQLTLVTRFEGRQGGVVISDPAIKLLPGLNPRLADSRKANPSAAERFDSGVRTVGHLEADGNRWDHAAGVPSMAATDPPSLTLPNRSSALRASDNGHAPYEQSGKGRILNGRDGDGEQTIDLPPSFLRHFRSSPARNNPNSHTAPGARDAVLPPGNRIPPQPPTSAGGLPGSVEAVNAAAQPGDTEFADKVDRSTVNDRGSRHPYDRYPRFHAPIASPGLRRSNLPAQWMQELPSTPRTPR